MQIQLDFDGTVVEHQYPKIGRENFGSMKVIKKLQEAGHEIIINTYRADLGSEPLKKAIEFLNFHHKVELKPITKYNLLKRHPLPWDWHIMRDNEIIWIDDIASDMPVKDSNFGNGKMVDWRIVDLEFSANGIY